MCAIKLQFFPQVEPSKIGKDGLSSVLHKTLHISGATYPHNNSNMEKKHGWGNITQKNRRVKRAELTSLAVFVHRALIRMARMIHCFETLIALRAIYSLVQCNPLLKHCGSCSHVLDNEKVNAYQVPSRKKTSPIQSAIIIDRFCRMAFPNASNGLEHSHYFFPTAFLKAFNG